MSAGAINAAVAVSKGVDEEFNTGGSCVVSAGLTSAETTATGGTTTEGVTVSGPLSETVSARDVDVHEVVHHAAFLGEVGEDLGVGGVVDPDSADAVQEGGLSSSKGGGMGGGSSASAATAGISSAGSAATASAENVGHAATASSSAFEQEQELRDCEMMLDTALVSGNGCLHLQNLQGTPISLQLVRRVNPVIVVVKSKQRILVRTCEINEDDRLVSTAPLLPGTKRLGREAWDLCVRRMLAEDLRLMMYDIEDICPLKDGEF